MLLPDNVHPENTVYYNGAFVLGVARARPGLDWLDLYAEVRDSRNMSVAVFVLCLDWLFLLELVVLDNYGRVQICS
ncbi:ABC-three component system middle component 6 [Zoogloea sp.]|uniref:ABC-three component system middle component 6 n=1 Tax=Zoogloea sp. TaxID=49181 RepID=UPI003416155D